ncbi:MAG: hypothetical protein P1U32_09450 [Legionellaceae bacterium]|nr:hypothetical protein [Legionellaceae bacterium]
MVGKKTLKAFEKTKLETIVEGEDKAVSAALDDLEEELQKWTKDLPRLRREARKKQAPTSKKQLDTVLRNYSELRDLEKLKAQPRLELEAAEVAVNSLVEQYISALNDFKKDCQSAAEKGPKLAKRINALEDTIEHLKKDAKEPWSLERAVWQMRTLLGATSHFFKKLPANTWVALKGVGARLKTVLSALQALTTHSARKEAEEVLEQQAVADLSDFADTNIGVDKDDDFYVFDDEGYEKPPKAQAVPIAEVVAHDKEVEPPLTSEFVDEWIGSEKDGHIESLNEQTTALGCFLRLKESLLHGADRQRPSFFQQNTSAADFEPVVNKESLQGMLDRQAELLKECRWIKGEAKKILRDAKAQAEFELTPVQHAALQAVIKEARKMMKAATFSTSEKVKVEAYQKQIDKSQGASEQTKTTTGPGLSPGSDSDGSVV